MQVFDWFAALGGGEGFFSILKGLVGLIVYFAGFGLIWM